LIDEIGASLQTRYRLRTRGFAPALRDSEVITMSVAGEFLGIDTEEQIWEY
jgi:hypothetical protein